MPGNTVTAQIASSRLIGLRILEYIIPGPEYMAHPAGKSMMAQENLRPHQLESLED